LNSTINTATLTELTRQGGGWFPPDGSTYLRDEASGDSGRGRPGELRRTSLLHDKGGDSERPSNFIQTFAF
jgi:hypothetical protein